MSPVEVARNASEDARAICYREYGSASAPDFLIYGDTDFTFPYVPTHLHLMVFELVKNSLRAVQKQFVDSDKVAPPVRTVVAEGIEDVTIKVSDEGGGLPRSGLPKLFSYLYNTAKNQWMKILELVILRQWLDMDAGFLLAVCMLGILGVIFRFIPWKTMFQYIHKLHFYLGLMHIFICLISKIQKKFCPDTRPFPISIL